MSRNAVVFLKSSFGAFSHVLYWIYLIAVLWSICVLQLRIQSLIVKLTIQLYALQLLTRPFALPLSHGDMEVYNPSDYTASTTKSAAFAAGDPDKPSNQQQMMLGTQKLQVNKAPPLGTDGSHNGVGWYGDG